MRKVILVSVLVLVISLAYSFAEVPCKINYQGRLIKDNVPVNAPVDMEFRLYTVETGGSPIKTISTNNVPVYNGLFRAVLDLEGVDWTAGQQLYLEVKAGNDILSPREPIYAYPYAINTHLLEGKPREYFLDVSGSTQTKQGGLNIMGNVGIGTTNPKRTLDVDGTIAVRGGANFVSDWVPLANEGTVDIKHNLGYVPFCVVMQTNKYFVVSIREITKTWITLNGWSPGLNVNSNVKVYCW